MLFAACLLLALTASANLVANTLPARARGGKIYADLLARDAGDFAATNTTPNYFDQMVDHANPAAGVFQQKYYIDNTYWNSTGPVYLYISGEGPLSSSPGGYVAVLAQQHGALMVALEHRWYGESLPGNITITKQLENLNVANVMQDLSFFIYYMEDQLGGGKRNWVVIGGSYAGALSAWFRQVAPGLAVMSYSSSGVVNTIENFTQFDRLTADALGPTCSASIRAFTSAMELAWNNATSRADMLSQFNAPSDLSLEDFAWMMADSAAMGAQYGYKAVLCSMMVPQPPTPAALIATFANWTNTHYGTSFGASCYYSTACLSNVSRVAEWYNDKPWVWQCCSQFEWWQIAYPGSLRSHVITLEYFRAQCAAAFGVVLTPNTTEFNIIYGGNKPNTTKVVATNGSDDPWQGACVRQSVSDMYVEQTATCNGCGHCGDLHTPLPSDPQSLVLQRAFVDRHVTAWEKTADV